MAGTFLSGIGYQAGGLAVALGAMALAVVLAGAFAASRRWARVAMAVPEPAVSSGETREDLTPEDLAARGPYPP